MDDKNGYFVCSVFSLRQRPICAKIRQLSTGRCLVWCKTTTDSESCDNFPPAWLTLGPANCLQATTPKSMAILQTNCLQIRCILPDVTKDVPFGKTAPAPQSCRFRFRAGGRGPIANRVRSGSTISAAATFPCAGRVSSTKRMLPLPVIEALVPSASLT